MSLAALEQLRRREGRVGILEATPGIEPGCTDLQSAA